MTIDLAAAVAALIGRPLGDGERLAVAVSGGPDSLALLLLAQAAFGARIVALTVDHGLRTEAATDAATVGAVCAARGVEHDVLRWTGVKPAGNLQAAAREARYRLMRDWCAANGVAWLATAHHRDDIAETLLLRLARGSGLAGLSGPRRSRDLGRGVTLLRPLLTRSHAELAAVAAAAGLTPADDPANRDPRFDRSAARAALAATPWLAAERLAASAAHLRAAEAALDWAAARAWDSRAAVTPHAVSVDAGGLPQELARRLVVRALAELAPQAVPRGPDIVRLLDALTAGRTATLAGIEARGGTIWRFRIEARQRR